MKEIKLITPSDKQIQKRTVEELFEEFATLKYLESEENEYVTNEKYAQIIQEVKSQTAKEVLNNLNNFINNAPHSENPKFLAWYKVNILNYALSKEITLEEIKN